jgi:hypothetical protein
LKRKIKVKVKTYFGPRKTYEVELLVTTDIAGLLAEVTRAVGPEVMESVTSPKVYYPMVPSAHQGFVQHLSSQTKTLSDYNVADGAALILMGQASTQLKWRSADLLPGTSVASSHPRCPTPA